MRRMAAFLVVLGMALYVAVGTAPVFAAPSPAPTAVPSEWYEPLPGQGVDDPDLIGPREAFRYEAAPHLLEYADLDPPKPEDLLGLKRREAYTYGTLNRMLAEWAENKAPGLVNRPASEVKKRWKVFVQRHVRGVDSNSRGDGFADWVFGKVRIAGSDDYVFDEKVDPRYPVEPDAFPVKPHLKRGFEVKDTRQLTKRAQAQLQGYVELVDGTGNQVVYVFRVKPTKGTLSQIDDANKSTAVNEARIAAGLPPAPAIVVRLMPAIPQPTPTRDPAYEADKARRAASSPAPSATGNDPGNDPGKPVGPAPVPPKGGGGIMIAPGAPQHPVDGGLSDAIADSPDSPDEAAFGQEVLDQLGADLGNEDLGADPLGGVDFSTLELRYVADTYQGGPGLQYAFSAQPAPEDHPSYGGRRAALTASDAFFVWLVLPTSAFTVNLNPDEPNRIIDSQFGRTDAGRILLEADLEMKKTVAKLIHPDSATGKRYWDGLVGETKCVSMRQWIVPAPATVREDQGQLYILDAPLSVKMETDYVKSVGVGGSEAGCARQSDAETKQNESLYRRLILPQIEKAVNTAPEYADLRRVYVSRVAAQWYRERSETKRTTYSHLIDRGDASDWPARQPWSPKEVWRRYVKSYTDGEFKVKRTTQRGNMIETVTYVYGGVDLTDVPRSRLNADTFSGQRPELSTAVRQATYAAASEGDRNLVWLGGESTARPLTELQAARRSPTSKPAFWVLTTLPLLLWLVGGAIQLARRRGRRPSPSTTATTTGP